MSLNIKDYLENTSLEVQYDGTITDHDVVISTVIFFAAVAKADGHLESEEINSIIGIVVREYDVSEAEAARLLEVALLLSEDTSKLDSFIKRVCENFDPLQKQLVMTLVWRVMLSDNNIEKHEANLAVNLRNKLGLTLEEAVRTRKLAELDVVSLAVLKNELQG